jgi:hypothetical protein
MAGNKFKKRINIKSKNSNKEFVFKCYNQLDLDT